MIKNWLKKKFDLWEKSEVYDALEKAINDKVFNNTVSSKTTSENLEKFAGENSYPSV